MKSLDSVFGIDVDEKWKIEILGGFFGGGVLGAFKDSGEDWRRIWGALDALMN